MSKSSNKTNSALVSGGLRQIFTTSIVVCLVIYAVISLFSTFFNFSYYDSSISTLLYDLNFEEKTKEPFYIIYTYYEDVYIGAILGFLLGFFQFGFLSDKNACYTRLSFGIKRKALFFSNAFYPLICAIFIVIISKLLAVIVNIFVLGLHLNIIKMFILSVLATIIPIIFSFTVTVIANILTTRKIETILLTVSVTALPYAIFGLICNIFSITLYGYGNEPYAENEISNLLSKINPSDMLFDIGEFGYFSYGVTEKTSLGEEILWCIICICTCLGALLLTANFFEKRFKPENCGKKGASKLSLTLISFAASALVCVSIIEHTHPDYTYTVLESETRIIIALVLGTAAAIVLNLLVMLGKKKIKQGLLGAGISAGIIGLLIVIGLTGCFGFSTKIPDTEDIESIYVCTPFDDMYESAYNQYFQEAYSFSFITTAYKEDFDIIKNIHKSALKTKDLSETSIEYDIEYTLKNGDVISRYYYDVSEETAMESIKLWDTKAVKDYYKVKLNQGKPEETSEDAEILESRDDFYFNNQPVSSTDYLVIVSKDLTITDLSNPESEPPYEPPTEEIKFEIMAALYKDICNLSAEQWFMPKEQYGALIFDCTSKKQPGESPLFDDVFSDLNAVFYINSDMLNTVNLLKKYGYFQYFECKKEVEKAHIVTSDNLARWVQITYDTDSAEHIYNNTDVKHSTYYAINNYDKDNYLSSGCNYLDTLYADDITDYSDVLPDDYSVYYDSLPTSYLYNDYMYDNYCIVPPPTKDINNKAEAKKMVKNAFMAYNLGNSGEFIVVKFTDGSCTILAIPE